jgi:hypothetical protein
MVSQNDEERGKERETMGFGPDNSGRPAHTLVCRASLEQGSRTRVWM